MPLLREKAEDCIGNLGRRFHLSTQKMAEGILEVVNAQMANAIRSITIRKGIDPRDFTLVAFGGAGPMHAAFIARELSISRVMIPNVAGAFSAWGMLTTDIRHDVSQTYIVPLSEVEWSLLETRGGNLESELTALLSAEGLDAASMRFFRSLDMRYVGQEYFINVPLPEDFQGERNKQQVLKQLFDDMYDTQYGHKNLAEEVEIVNLRLEAHGLIAAGDRMHSGISPQQTENEKVPVGRNESTRTAVFSGKAYDTPFIGRDLLAQNSVYSGPVVIEEKSCTTVVPPGFTLTVDSHGNLIVSSQEDSR